MKHGFMKTIVLIIFTVFSLLFSGCDRSANIQKQTSDDSKKEWLNAIANFAKEYNAQADWESHITQRSTLKSPFSIDISRALMPTNGQSVLLVMELKDVAEGKNGFSLKFDGYFFENQDFHLSLDAQCSPELANKVLEMSKGKMLEFADFAVVVKVENVSRIGFEVQGTTEGTPPDEPPNLEVVNSPDTFIVKGKCIDVIHRDTFSTSRP